MARARPARHGSPRSSGSRTTQPAPAEEWEWTPRAEDWWFPEAKTWAVPGFVPEEGVPGFPRAAREKQQAAFDRGYAALRQFPRGMQRDRPSGRQYPRPTFDEVGECLPYFVSPWQAHALARILLALNDPRTPKDIRKALPHHVRDVLRDDRLLYDARPLPLREARVAPEVRRVFPAVHKELLRLCKSATGTSVEDVDGVLRRHVPEKRIESDARKAVSDILRGPMKPHLKAKAILGRLFGIPERSVRKLIYGW